MPFLVCDDEGAVWVDADTICSAESVRNDFGVLPVLAHP